MIKPLSVHQIRNSLKYITSEDQKPFLRYLKKVYRANTKESAEFNLDKLDKKWGKKYRNCDSIMAK